MVRRKAPTRDEMRKAEKEIGENIPQGMIGLDDADVRDVELPEGEAPPVADEDEEPSSRH